MRFEKIWKVIRESFKDFMASKVFKLSASLAYYTVFSLPALLIIVIWISELIYGENAVRGAVFRQIEEFIGRDAAIQVQETLKNAALSSEGGLPALIGLVTLVIGASTVFAEMQDSINRIWRIKVKPREGRGLLRLVINRLISFSMVVTLGFLMLVSLLINSLIDIFIENLAGRFPDVHLAIVYVINLVVTFFIITALFAVIFKVLPDANIKWKQARVGAIVTAVLFMIGKYAINFYLGQSKVSSVYGAAGSMILILLWVFYSAVILYFGAVFTKAWAVISGQRIHPSKYAVWVEEKEVSPSRPTPPRRPAR